MKPGSLSPESGPTEDSLAREFVAIHGQHWRFDHTAKRWYHWDGQRWVQDDCRLIGYMIAEHLRAAKASIASVRKARGVETFAGENRVLAVTHERWDADPWLLGTPSGTVDLRTGKLTPADPRHHITKLTATAPGNGIPVVWLRFLDEVTGGDQDMVAYLQRWCGYCLTGLTREHAFAFIYGPGGNGKSVFLNTVSGLMADYAVTAAMNTFTDSRNERHSTELAMLAGARLVTASETEQGRGWAEAKVKAMTGGDPITAQFMRQDNFTYTPQFKLMIAGNHAPSLRGVDDAMQRRLNVLPFVVKPKIPDRELEAKLEAEWPQILAWMIAGCLKWQDNGLQRPAKVSSATEGYFNDQDVFGDWLAECCVLGSIEYEKPTPLFESWRKFAQDAGAFVGTARDLKSIFERHGIHQRKSNGVNTYRGVALKVDNNAGE